jgi:hypothetical protein
MKPITHNLNLTINLAAHDGAQYFATEDIVSALQKFGVVTKINETNYLSRSSSELMATTWIRFRVGDASPCYATSSHNDRDCIATEIGEDRLQYLRDNGVCVEMVFEMPNSQTYVPPAFVCSSYEANATFVSSFGFAVDINVFDAKWLLGDAKDIATCWLRMELAPCRQAPMHKMNQHGTVDLEAYDPALLGFMCNGQQITYPFFSPDGQTQIDPRTCYGFTPSQRGGCEDKLEKELEGGDYLLMSEHHMEDPQPTIGRYNSAGYMVALCELSMIPIHGEILF